MRVRVVALALTVIVGGCESPPAFEPRPEPQVAQAPPTYERYDERAALEREALEEEWPEPTPLIFLRGEPGPASTSASRVAAPVRVAQLEAAARASQSSSTGCSEETNRRLDAATFTRRCELMDDATLAANEKLVRKAQSRTREWVTERLTLVQEDPDAARREGIYAPSSRDAQAHFDDELTRLRADWVKKDRLEKSVDETMSAVDKPSLDASPSKD